MLEENKKTLKKCDGYMVLHHLSSKMSDGIRPSALH